VNGQRFDKYVAFSEEARAARDRAVDVAESLNFAEDAVEELARKNMHVSPFPAIPSSLVGIIQVIIPGESDRTVDPHGGGGNQVDLTPILLAEHGDNLTPALSAAHVHQIQQTGAVLTEYWSYATAYLSYIRSQHAYLQSMQMTYDARQQFLRNELIALYANAEDRAGRPIKAMTQTAYIQNDPKMVEYSHQLGRIRSHLAFISGLVKSLEDVVKLCSRMMTDRHKEMSMTLQGPPGGRSSDPRVNELLERMGRAKT